MTSATPGPLMPHRVVVRRRTHGHEVMRWVRRPMGDADTSLFSDGANLTTDLTTRRDRRVHIRVGRTRPDGGAHRG